MKKIVLHAHTKHSYDVDTSYYQIVKRCIEQNVDTIAVTDHNEIDGAKRLKEIAPFEVILGEEILTSSGEIIGLFLKEIIEPGQTVEKTIEEIRSQGGLIYLPHPFDRKTRKTALSYHGIKKFANEFDFVEIYNGRTVDPRDNEKARKFAIRQKLLQVVGDDAHTHFELGRNYMLVSKTNRSDIKMALKSGKKTTSTPLYWSFLLTKWARYKKRKFSGKHSFSNVGHKCDLCKSTRIVKLFNASGTTNRKYTISDDSYGVHGQINKCFDCELVFAHPTIKAGQIEKRYEDFVDNKYESERDSRVAGLTRLLQRLEQVAEKGNLLDVGCATGALVEAAKDRGWTAEGVDPSRWAGKIGRKKGLKITAGTISDIGRKDYDVVTLVDVIEHVVSPDRLLKEVNLKLVKLGILCLVTPDYGSHAAKILRERWWHVRPDHVYYFDKKTVELMLIKNGFEVIDRRRYVWNFSLKYWLSRLETRIALVDRIINSNNKYLNCVLALTVSINFHDSMEIYARKIKNA